MISTQLKILADTPTDALKQVLEDGLKLSENCVSCHLIIDYLAQEGRQWKVVLTVIYEPFDEEGDGSTETDDTSGGGHKAPKMEKANIHLLIKQQYEPHYRDIAKLYKFSYVHIIPEGKFWDTMKEHQLDIELYEAVHAKAKEKTRFSFKTFFPFFNQKPKAPFLSGPK